MNAGIQQRPSLAREHFYAIIIGGGINGVSIARECARAGRRVLVLEQSDFAAGTTSRATRIIHGGLRYLEHGDISLVRESLREREHLLQQHHLVRRMDFVLALPRHSSLGRSALAIRTGLWLYRRLAPTTQPSHKIDYEQLQRALDRGQSLQFFSYSDAQCEFPERLTAEWLSEAITAGAVPRNYATVMAVEVHNGVARGVRVQDRLTGEEYSVTADWVINAAGPWVDSVNQHAQSHIGRLIGGVRGSHLVFKHMPPGAEALTANHTAIYTEATDGRPIFAIPWAGQLLFGTTEVAQEQDDDLANVQPNAAEIEYLLSSARRLFGSEKISAADVHYAYAGVRPLPYAPAESMAAVSRSHMLRDHADEGITNYISVVGGKLTTAGNLGRQCARKIGCEVSEPALAVAAHEADGMDLAHERWAQSMATKYGLTEAQVNAIAEWHGPRTLCVIRAAKSAPLLRKPIVAGSNHLLAEAVEAVQFECAVKLSDILLRRAPIALGPDWNDRSTDEAALNIGKALGWDEKRIAVEAEEFDVERGAFLRKVEAGVTPGR